MRRIAAIHHTLDYVGCQRRHDLQERLLLLQRLHLLVRRQVFSTRVHFLRHRDEHALLRILLRVLEHPGAQHIRAENVHEFECFEGVVREDAISLIRFRRSLHRSQRADHVHEREGARLRSRLDALILRFVDVVRRDGAVHSLQLVRHRQLDRLLGGVVELARQNHLLHLGELVVDAGADGRLSEFASSRVRVAKLRRQLIGCGESAHATKSKKSVEHVATDLAASLQKPELLQYAPVLAVEEDEELVHVWVEQIALELRHRIRRHEQTTFDVCSQLLRSLLNFLRLLSVVLDQPGGIDDHDGDDLRFVPSVLLQRGLHLAHAWHAKRSTVVL